MDQSTVQPMLLITLRVIPLTAFIAVGVSHKLIRCAIRVSTMRNQRKVRSESMSQNENRSRKKSANEFHMVAEQVNIKGLSRAQINAVRLKVKDFLPEKLKGDRSQFNP
eukprot:5334234-Amphidinium_carterae.1